VNLPAFRFAVVQACLTLALCGTAAHAETPTSLSISPVVRATGGGSPLSATFVNPDINFGAFNSYTLQVPPNLSAGGYAGVNLPSLHAGLLPNIGDFAGISFYYTPLTGTSPVDPSLRYVAQTSDGIYHITPPSITSSQVGEENDYNYGTTLVYGGNGVTPNDFAPQIVSKPVNKLAILFFGISSCRNINIVLWEISGSSGRYGEGSGQNGGGFFTYQTVADHNFNFELTRNNL
jgi:hypothetical protein